jgi:methionine-rich copper-binding protein CopC
MRHVIGRVIAMSSLGLLLGLAPQTGASAHSQLLSSIPADGAVLAVAPDRVELTFNESLIPKVDTIAINDDQGNVVSTQQAQPEGATISAPWPAGLPAGTYQVAYRVVSGDGHPVTGAITLTITSGGSAPAAVLTSASPVDSTTSVAVEDGMSTSRIWVVGAGVLMLVVALLLIAVRRTRRR